MVPAASVLFRAGLGLLGLRVSWIFMALTIYDALWQLIRRLGDALLRIMMYMHDICYVVQVNY